MTELDDKILKQFFEENKQEIADDGFTRRVMKSLPDRNLKIFNILTAAVTVIAVIVFLLFDGILIVLNVLRQLFTAVIETGATHLDLKTIAIIAAVLLFWGVRKIYSME